MREMWPWNDDTIPHAVSRVHPPWQYHSAMTRLPSALSLAAVLIAASSASAQWLKTPTPGIPRTSDGKPNLTAPAPRSTDGHPDLSGLWRTDPGGYNLDIVSDLKPREILPWAQELSKKRSEEFGKDFPGYRCMPDIGPFATFGFFKVLQTPSTMAMLPEGGAYRQILTDGRALPADPNPTWQGYAIGRWEGDTFVIESAGFNDRSWLDFSGHPHSEALRVIERIRRPDFGHMTIEITFEDRKAYTRAWTIKFDATYAADTELLESVCNENEKSLQHFVITDEDRRKSRSTVKVSPEILSRYVGTYEGVTPAGRKETFEVKFDGERLTAAPTGGGGFVLVPESDTRFTASGAVVIFNVDSKGVVSNFVVRIVEGDQVYKKIK
jgi:hypothetical protein